MPEYTPGPWHLMFETEYGDFGSVVSQGLIGVTSESETICEFNDLQSRTTGANARLIAAAPELLEAAQAVVNHRYLTHGTAVGVTNGKRCSLTPDLDTVCAACTLREAIRKATGERA